MSKATVKTIAQTNAELYDRLLVSIEAGIGLLQIFIAICDNDRQREQLITNYEQELSPNIHSYRVKLNLQEPSIRQAIASVITVTENAIVTVSGAETLGLLTQSSESLTKFFGYLQWTREAFRELQLPIVLWIPSRILNQIAKRSPDFWSWRNGVFYFQPETSLSIAKLTDFQSINFIEDNESNSILSIKQLEGSLAKAIATWGKDDIRLSTLYSQLGSQYVERCKWVKSSDRERELALAEKYLNRAIELQTKFEQLETLAISIDNLATLYRIMGRYTEAEPWYVQSLAIREKQLNTNHPATAASLNNLAGLYRAIGRYDQAEPLYIQSLAIREEQLGANHPDTAASLNNLAGLYESIGRYTEANSLYAQALQICDRSLGLEHPQTKIVQDNYAQSKKASESRENS